MNMQVAQCSQCGGKLEPSNGKDVATCAYCGHSVVLREVIKVQMQGDVGSLMALAESALDAENGQKALEYYTEALEYDGTNSEAWFGRAQAVALTSFSNDLQIRETVSNFRKAIEYVSEKEQQQMASRVARKLNDLCVFFHAHAKELLKNYGYEEKAWKDYLDECQRIRITFELALYLEPHDKEIIENLLLLCNDNIEGYTYKDSDSGRICKYRPSLHYSERLNGLCDRYQGIQKLQDKEHLSQHRQPLNVFEVYTERLNTAKCASRLLNEIESHSLGNGGIPLFAGVTLAFLAWYFEWEHIAIYLSVLGLIFLGAKMWDANSKELAQKKSAYTELVQEEDALFDL